MLGQRVVLGVVVLFLSIPALTVRGEQSLSYGDLVQRMMDLENLARLPQAGETCSQWSSWDRVSKYDEKSGKYIAWDANGDNNGCIRMEGTRMVMAEMEGPGCICRIWSAQAEKGHVKVYLDGQETPAVDLPFVKYFSGDTAPFNYPKLSYNLGTMGASGQNLYMPIPYQKSCKIVADEGWGAYYHITYRTFPKGTQVPTFSTALAAENSETLKKVNDFFAQHLGQDPVGARSGQETVTKTLTLAPGEKATVAELAGPRAITSVKVKRIKFADRADQMAGLRKIALQIKWDGQSKPAVWCPLGDFFGTAPGENLYRSLMTGMTEAGYYAYWYMPFAKSAVVELANEDKTPRTVEMEIVHAPISGNIDDLGRFHAKWHRDTTPLSKDRFPDWIMLKTEGRGRFCGVMLHVWNPRGGWWGEGDEKFFVDNEKFPSTFGTGSEDYFGYAWCHPGLFQQAYHCQTMTQNNQGHQSVLRWQVIDNVPFQKAFEGCIEKYDHPGPDVRYACTTCFYLSPEAVDPYDAVPATKRDGYYTMSPLVIAGCHVLDKSAGNVQPQDMRGFTNGQWPNKDQMWWTNAGPGAKLKIGLPIKADGSYRVDLTVTKARDYAIVQFYLDGRKVGEPVDLFHSPDVTSAVVSLGGHQLAAGDHTLTVEIVGANPKALKGYMFGLNDVKCEPVKP